MSLVVTLVRRGRHTFAVLLLACLATGCSSADILFDVSEVREESLAFVVFFTDGQPDEIGDAVGVDATGAVVFGDASLDKISEDAKLVIVSYADIDRVAGGDARNLLPDDFAQARLVLGSSPNPPLIETVDGREVWRGPVPIGASIQPPLTDAEFVRDLHLRVPALPESKCFVPGPLVDVVTDGSLKGDFNDVLPVGPGRALVLHRDALLDVQRADDGTFSVTEFAAATLRPSSYFGSIARSELIPSVIWVSRHIGGDDSTLDRFNLLETGIEYVSSATITGMIIRAITVANDGAVLSVGDVDGGSERRSVWLEADGSIGQKVFITTEPTMFRLIGPTGPRQQYFTGNKGELHRLLRNEVNWDTEELNDETTQVRVNGLAGRVAFGSINELWVAADTGRLFRRLADLDPALQQVLTPPRFSCLPGETDRFSLNLMDIDILGDSLALVPLEACSDVLVFDLQGLQCASVLRYQGTAQGSTPLRLRLSADDTEVWTVGIDMIRYANVE